MGFVKGLLIGLPIGIVLWAFIFWCVSVMGSTPIFWVSLGTSILGIAILVDALWDRHH